MNPKTWSQSEISEVIKLWPYHSIIEIAGKMQVTEDQVKHLLTQIRSSFPNILPTRKMRKEAMKSKIEQAIKDIQ